LLRPGGVSVRLVVVVVSLAVAGCCPGPSTIDELFLIRDPDAETQALIDACRDPVHPDCGPLCAKVARFPGPSFQHCELHPDHDGYIQVHVGYTVEAACL